MTENPKYNFVENDTIFIHGIFDNDISIKVLPKFDQLINQEKDKKMATIYLNYPLRLKKIWLSSK